jgi:hypothetical protein
MEKDTNVTNGTNSVNDTITTNGTNHSAVAAVPLVGIWYPAVDVPNLMILALIAVLGLGNLGVVLSFAQAKALRKPFNVIVLGRWG